MMRVPYQRLPMRSNTKLGSSKASPEVLAAVAMQPLVPHIDRTFQTSDSAGSPPARCLPVTSSCGPYSTLYVPVNGPELGCAAVGVEPLSERLSTTPTTMPIIASTATMLDAKTILRFRFGFGPGAYPRPGPAPGGIPPELCGPVEGRPGE